jgi:peptide/nickel transport system substrate-binding protein
MNTRIIGGTRSRRAVIGALLLLTAIFGQARPAAAGDLKIGMAAALSAVDPHYHLLATNMSVLAHIFESLVHQDEQQRPGPGLATSWHLVDPTTWEFQLRHGVLFHRGGRLGRYSVSPLLSGFPAG